jgi:hypothetical protein
LPGIFIFHFKWHYATGLPLLGAFETLTFLGFLVSFFGDLSPMINSSLIE